MVRNVRRATEQYFSENEHRGIDAVRRYSIDQFLWRSRALVAAVNTRFYRHIVFQHNEISRFIALYAYDFGHYFPQIRFCPSRSASDCARRDGFWARAVVLFCRSFICHPHFDVRHFVFARLPMVGFCFRQFFARSPKGRKRRFAGHGLFDLARRCCFDVSVVPMVWRVQSGASSEKKVASVFVTRF